MKNYKLHTTEGFSDTFGYEMLIKNEIKNRIEKLFKSYGYDLIKTPALEYIDVYSSGGMQKPDLYNLINRQGEVLSLCNDMTSSIVRFVASNNLEGKMKFSYTADIFRYPKQYQGKKHQFLQAGIEYIGENNINAEIETIYIAHKALKAIGINDFTIHVGSIKFLNLLFKDFNLSDDIIKKIKLYIEENDYVSLNEVLKSNLDESKAKFLYELMLKGGKLKFIEHLILDLKDYSCVSELKFLKQIYNSLRELGTDKIIFDFSICSYAKYYTGIVFSVYVDNISKEVISGGRSDILFNEFDKDLADIGFGLDIDALGQYALENNTIKIENQKYLSYHDSYSSYAYKNDDNFRDNGIIVNNLDFSSLDEAFKYAKANDYDKIIYYKDDSFSLVEVK